MELNNLQRELKNRRKNNPLKYFWPHQKNCDGKHCNEAVIEFNTFDGKKHLIKGCPQYSFLNSKAKTKAFFGSNRSGKTTAGAIEVGYHTTGLYPDWWQGWKWNRHTKGRIFAQDYTKGGKVITEKLHQWLPKDSILHITKNSLQVEWLWQIKHKSGGVSEFDLMSYEQEAALAEGWSGDWVLFDEPPPRQMYVATIRGLVDTDGLCMFTLTPLREPWLFDEIYNSKSSNVFSVLCDMRHNLRRFNPLSRQYVGLNEVAIRRYEESLTEEERETRMHGKFRYLAGRIWKEWDREIHTYDRLKKWPGGKLGEEGKPPRHWPRCMILDPHDRNPHAVMWVALDETGESWFYREAWLKDKTIEEAVEHIKQVELSARERVQLRIIDPNFGPKRYANSGNTVRDEFEQAGKRLNYPIRFSFGDDHKEVGRKRVAEMLKYDPKKPPGLLNHPQWHFASDLKEAIYQIEHYIWDEFKVSDRDPKEKPKDVNTHFPDVLHYYALSGFKGQKPMIHEGRGSLYGT